jgi:Toxin SymE, type I toxin-antitoxin system
MAIAKCIEPLPPNIEACAAETRQSLPQIYETRSFVVGYGHPGPGSRPKTPETGIVPPVPRLRLQGQWLAKAGFHIGMLIKVHVAHGMLVVQAAEAARPEAEPAAHRVHEPASMGDFA